jgi:hypothetical protein
MERDFQFIENTTEKTNYGTTNGKNDFSYHW